MSGASGELRIRYGIDYEMLDIFQRDALLSRVRAARPDLTEGQLRQEVFLICYGDEFSLEQREKILAAIASHWQRKVDSAGTLPMESAT